MTDEQIQEGQDQSALTRADRAKAKKRTPVIAVVAVVAVAAVVLGILGARGTFKSAPTYTPIPSVVLVPPPTPTVAPVPYEATTDLGATIPEAVLAYALAVVTEVDTRHSPDDPLQVAGAVEAYRITYTNGSEQIHLELAQWREEAEADAYAQSVLASAPTESVSGVSLGVSRLWEDGDGGFAIWTNGTVVLTATGPYEDLISFQEAYPL